MRIMSKIVAGRLCLASLSMSSPSNSHRRISRSLTIPRCVIVQPSLVTFPSSSLGHVGRISGHVLRLLLVAALVVFLLLALLILVLLNSSLGDELLED